MRSKFTREMLHPRLPDAAWNAFIVGDYDTAVFDAFKSVEVAVRTKDGFTATDFGAPVMKRAFDPNTGPLRDKAAPPARQMARCDLFTGAFGEIRNPITVAWLRGTATRPLLGGTSARVDFFMGLVRLICRSFCLSSVVSGVKIGARARLSRRRDCQAPFGASMTLSISRVEPI